MRLLPLMIAAALVAAPAAAQDDNAATTIRPGTMADQHECHEQPVDTNAEAPPRRPTLRRQSPPAPAPKKSFPWGVLGLLGLVGLFGEAAQQLGRRVCLRRGAAISARHEQQGHAAGTQLVEGGRRKAWRGRLVNPPVQRASTILFDSVADMEASRPGLGEYRYGLQGTATQWALAEALTELEPGAEGTALYSSGLAAITTAC